MKKFFNFAEITTLCERKRQEAYKQANIIDGRHAVGVYIPQCNEDGEFSEAQCHGSTGYCWCVDKEGKELPRTSFRSQRPECSRSKHIAYFVIAMIRILFLVLLCWSSEAGWKLVIRFKVS